MAPQNPTPLSTPARPIGGALLALFTTGLLLAGGCNRSGTEAPASPAPAASAPAPVARPAQFKVAMCLGGKCGVLDQNATLLIPFDNDFDGFAPFLFDDRVLANKNGQWMLMSPRADASTQAVAAEIFEVAPTYFGFRRDGKIGLMNAQGLELQAPRFDGIHPGEQNFTVYEIEGKQGILDLQGQALTEAVYEGMVVRGNIGEQAGLVTADRGKEHWVIRLRDGAQKKVDYTALSRLRDGHMVVSGDGTGKGLVDAQGELVIPMKHEWLGQPGAGLVAFREANDLRCGYLDYTGKVVIPPRFSSCEPFGKKGALVGAKADAAGNDTVQKIGLIGHDGAWLLQPTYDSAGAAGRGLLGMLRDVPGQAHVTQAEKIGLFDLDQGHEIVAPTYPNLGFLAPDRFVFGTEDSPEVPQVLMGQEASVPAVGIMDGRGEVLLSPRRFVHIELHASGKYLLAQDGAEVPVEALYDLDGHELIAPEWQSLVVDGEHSVILGYAVEGLGDNAVRTLRAVYDLRGKPIFKVHTTPCGSQQLQDGQGKAIWPADAACGSGGKP